HLASRISHPADVQTLQALLDLSGPGGYVLLLGSAAQHAVGLAGLMSGIHFVGVNAPDDVAELPVLSLLDCETMIPLLQKVGRAAVVGQSRDRKSTRLNSSHELTSYGVICLIKI